MRSAATYFDMADTASDGLPTPPLLAPVLRACLLYGLLVGLGLAVSITWLNHPLRTLPDLLVAFFYLALVYGAASLALGAGVAAAIRLAWPGPGRGWRAEDVRSLAAAGFVGFGVFFYLGSWWRFRVSVVEQGSLLSPLAIAKLAAALVAAVLAGWLVFVLHRKLAFGFSKVRWVALPVLAALLGVWLFGAGYSLGRTPKDDAQPAADFRLDPTGTKVLLVALDAANWKTLGPLLEAGRLPVLAGLVETGASGPLTTFEPTESPLIWNTVATGMTPKKHGIRDYVVTKIPGLNTSYVFGLVQASYPRFTGVRLVINLVRKLGWIETLPVTSDMRRAKALWDILGEAGFTVGVNSWWATWPAEEVNGYLVSEYISMTPEPHAESLDRTLDALTYPPTLYPEIRPLLKSPDEPMARAEVERFLSLSDEELARLNGPYTENEPLSNFKWIYHRDANTWSSEKMLMERFRPGFSTFYLRGIDIISHLFWQYVEPEHFEGIEPADVARFGDLLGDYTALVDSILGELLELIDDDTVVVVVSDHGMEATGELPLSGNHPHAPDGIVIVSGKNIRATRLEGVSVFDIAPTILHLMGLPLSKEMDGRVITEMIAPDFLQAHPVREIASYGARAPRRGSQMSEESREEIEQRLRALGYLD